MKTPLICHLSDFSPEYPGSFIDSLLFLARCNRDRAQIATLCIFPEKARGRRWIKKFDEERILYAFVPRTSNIVFNVRNVLRSYHPLIFHTHFSLFDLSAVFLKLLFYKEAKVVWHLHSLAQCTFRQRIKDVVKVKLLARHFVDRFITVGDGMYRNAIDRQFSQDKLTLVYNGINTTRFSSNTKRRKWMQESLGVSQEDTVFLLLGWSPFIKGVDLFTRAAAEIVRVNSYNAVFLIVGRKETRDFVSKIPESSRIGSTLRVIDPVEDFSLLLQGVDVLVSSSRTEGFGYAAVESMAAGKLVLCSDIPGVRETYGKSEGVWLFPPEDWKMLAVLMRRAQELAPIEWENLARVNSQYAVEHYSLEKWAERIGEIYYPFLKAWNICG